MRILRVISGLGTGGAETMLLRLLTHPAARRQENAVVSLTAGAMLARYRAAGVKVDVLGVRSPWALLSFPARLWRVTRRFAPDVIEGWMNHGNVAASIAARMSGTASLVWNIRQTIYDIELEKAGTRAVMRLEARWSARPDLILFNSAVAVKQHEAIGFRSRRAQVVPNGFDTDVFKPDAAARETMRTALGVDVSTDLVGLVARYHPMKGHETFLRAMALLIRSRPNARLVLIGSGLDNANLELIALMDRLDIRSHCLLLGERADMHKIYPALDVACLASAWGEGFPNVVGEAMACAVPCVATDVGDASLLIDDAKCIVPSRNAQALCNAVDQIFRMSPQERAALGRRARERIVSHFTIDQSVDAFQRFYDSLERA